LARRAPEFVAAAHAAWRSRHGAEVLATPFESRGVRLPGRVVDVLLHDGTPLTAAGLALRDARPPAGGPWAARLAAPEDEAELPAALSAVAALADGDPAFLAVHGGTALTRLLVCEQARMQHKLPALLVEPGLDTDAAVTTVLSGRADLVAG
jgi:anthraniloyl-CoA monooxygenase